MKQYRITLGGETLEVKLLDDPRQEQVRVEIDGEIITVGVSTLASQEAPTLAGAPVPELQPVAAAAPPASNTVSAPLPGVIKLVHVRAGQKVAHDDILVTIEAMKMDNVIRAQREGVISDILVSEGRQVAYGEALLEYES